MLSAAQHLSMAGAASTNPALTQLCPTRGCAAGTVGASSHPWGFWDGVSRLYLRVRSLFQAWQLMGSSRKL